MQSFKLFMRLSPYINIRWGLTGTACLCALLGIGLLLAEPLIFSNIIDRVLIGKETDLLPTLLWLAVLCPVASLILTTAKTGIFRYLGIRNTLDIRNVLTNHLRKVPLHEIEKNGVGRFVALFGMDAFTLANFLNHIVVELVSQFFMVIVAVGMILYLDWRLGLMALVTVPILLVMPKLFTKPLNHHIGHVRTHNEQIGAHLYECIDGSKEIRAFGLEKWEEQRNENMYRGLIHSSIRESLFRVVAGQAGSLPVSLIIVAVYWFGTNQVLENTLTVGMLVAAVNYLNNMLRPIQIMNHYFGDLQSTQVAIERIEAFLNTDIEQPARLEQAGPSALDEAAAATESDTVIECRDLYVAVDGVEILKGVDLSIPRGQVIAFVGRSGSGKSTLFRTLMGFLPHKHGTLVLGGTPIERMSRSNLREHLGMVFQEPFTFKGTIYENIQLGHFAATEAEVWEAADNANLTEFLHTLPEGIHTPVAYKGSSLSGGQKQRISIARAFLQTPEILILDEPTSALDRQTETEVMERLKRVMRGKTTLIATHRLDTVMRADVIYVLDQGRVAEFGTHEELMAREGIYHSMVLSGQEEGVMA
ncbi:MAG: ABC transporter ATP-binding protein [Tumebacillaceae bacterium]